MPLSAEQLGSFGTTDSDSCDPDQEEGALPPAGGDLALAVAAGVW
jgi:hypothetical protein